jgi:predicted MFS family arabinose efflux permease
VIDLQIFRKSEPLMTIEKHGARDEFARNWKVVLAGALGMALASAGVYVMGIFIHPLELEFGWSRAEIVAGMTIISLFGMICAPFVGLIVDRFGPRRIGVFGVLIGCASLASLSLTGPSIWSWWALWMPIALAGTCMTPTIWTSGVSSLFDTGRGMALALVLGGTALCSTLTPILGNYFIETLGWRHAFWALAGFWGILVIPVVLLFFTSASDRNRIVSVSQKLDLAALTGIGVREALHSGKYIRLALAAFLSTLVVVSLVTGLVPILTSLAIKRQTAANLAGLIGIASITGRLSGGYLLDRMNGNLIGAASMILAVVPCAMLLAFPGAIPVAAGAVLVLGFSLGVQLNAVTYLVSRHFGMLHYGVLFGIVVGLLSIATGTGPLLISFVYDRTNTYAGVLWGFIPVCLLTAILFASLGRYPVFDAPVATTSPSN